MASDQGLDCMYGLYVPLKKIVGLWDFVAVLCFAVSCFVAIQVLQSS